MASGQVIMTTGNEVKGKVVNYDGGKFQLRVAWVKTAAGYFTFCPYVVVSGGGFTKDHTATFEWTDHSKSANYKGDNLRTKEAVNNSDDNTVFYAQETKVTKKRTVHQAGAYFASPSSQVKAKVEQKYINKKKKKATHNVTEKVDTQGNYFSNIDGYVKISVSIGKNTSSVTLDTRGKPAAPTGVSATRQGNDERVKVSIKKVAATRRTPVRSLTLSILEDYKLSREYQDYQTKTFGNADSGGDINGLTDIDFDIRNQTQAGHAYKFKVTARNNVSGGSASTETQWYYTSPPDISDVSHRRLSNVGEKQNEVRFDREDSYIDNNYYKGFIAEYSNDLPTDTNQKWIQIPSADIKFYDPMYPSNPVSWGWMSKKHDNHVLFRHTNCLPDRTYRYRVTPYNYWNGSSGDPRMGQSGPSLDGTSVTYNEPYAPVQVAAVFNETTGFADLKVIRKANKTTADKMFIQRRDTPTSEWIDIPTGSGSEGISVTPRTDDDNTFTFTDEEIPAASGDNIRYRVALACSRTPADGTELVRGNGKSDWKESNDIITIVKPNPPILTMPVNNGYAIIDDGVARLAWIHSPKDGTPQEAAEIKYDIDGTVQTISVEAVGYYDLPIASMASGTVLKWSVRTKGKHRDYSDWSEEFTLSLYRNPTIEWLTPANNGEISNLPLPLSWRYSDETGQLDKLVLQIRQNGVLFAEYDLGTDLTDGVGQHSLSEFLFGNYERYQLELHALSTLGLSANALLNISVNYKSIDLTNGYEPNAVFDEETGVAYITISKRLNVDEANANAIAIDEATSAESEELDVDDPEKQKDPLEVSEYPIAKIYLYRVHDGSRVLVESIDIPTDDTAADTYEVVDTYAPINVDFDYEVLQITTAGEIALSFASMRFVALWWYVYYGDGEVVKARWNPSGSANYRRPEKQQIRYSGREYPVTYDSTANEETYSFNTTLYRDIDDGRETLDQFKDMMRAGGTGVWKSFEGDVYAADFDFSYSVDYTDGMPSWQCSLNVTRTDTEEEL